MIRIALTLIGGENWTGGYNYLLNLVRALVEHVPDRVQPVLFFGTDVDEKDAVPFELIAGAVVIRDAAFNEACKARRLRQALFIGCDQAAASAFAAQDINVVFEAAQFYGWRFPVPAVAWIPDFAAELSDDGHVAFTTAAGIENWPISTPGDDWRASSHCTIDRSFKGIWTTKGYVAGSLSFLTRYELEKAIGARVVALVTVNEITRESIGRVAKRSEAVKLAAAMF